MDGAAHRTDRRRRAAALAAVLGLAALIQVGLVLRAEVPSLDAVRFARAAGAIDRDGLLPALRGLREQPLFAVWVWLVHSGLVALLGEFPTAWAASVQIAAAVPLVLAAAPVSMLAARCWGTAAGAAAGILFSTIPAVARLGADGLSDSTHLLFAAVAVWAAVEAIGRWRRAEGGGRRAEGGGERVQGSGFRGQGGAEVPEPSARCEPPSTPRLYPETRSWSFGWPLIAGLAAGLAALTRAEVLVLPAALLVTLGALQFRPRSRRSWSGAAGLLGCFALGMGVVIGPYLAAVGSLAPREAWARLCGCYDPDMFAQGPAPPPSPSVSPAWRLPDGRPMSFAVKDPGTSLRRRGLGAAVPRFAGQLAEAFGYWVGGLGLAGLWRARRRPVQPAAVLLAAVFLLFSVAAVRFAAMEGYLEARHLALLVAAGIGAAGFGALQPGAWLPVVLAAAASLALLAAPLHASRAGHRQAGEWLAREAPRGAVVIDTRGWTGLYSGLCTRPYEEAAAVLADPSLAFVVVELGELERPSRRGRTLQTILAAAATPAAVFPDGDRLPEGWQPVAVYRWDAEKFDRWSAAQTAALLKEDRYARAHPRVRPDGGRGI